MSVNIEGEVPASTSRRRLSREGSVALFVPLVIGQVAFTFVGVWTVILSLMAFDGCEPSDHATICDYALGDAITPITLGMFAIALVVTLGLGAMFAVQGWRVHVAAWIGGVLSLAALVVGLVLVHVALGG